jgi:hypothetical protein
MHLLRTVVLSIVACLFAAFGISSTNGQAAQSIPTPPGNKVPKPAGPAGNLKVLNWAGFHAAVTYTFDDSIPSQIANYPKLQATGVRMTFFLVGASDGNSPVWAQAAKDGHELGNHTEHHCHADATGCAWGTYAGSLEAEYDLCTRSHRADIPTTRESCRKMKRSLHRGTRANWSRWHPDYKLTIESGEEDEWETLLLSSNDEVEVAVIERNPVYDGSTGQDEIADFLEDSRIASRRAAFNGSPNTWPKSRPSTPSSTCKERTWKTAATPCMPALGALGARRRHHPGRQRRLHQRGRLPHRLAVFRLRLRPVEHGHLQGRSLAPLQDGPGRPRSSRRIPRGEVPDDFPRCSSPAPARTKRASPILIPIH